MFYYATFFPKFVLTKKHMVTILKKFVAQSVHDYGRLSSWLWAENKKFPAHNYFVYRP
jgi:hypothetical protein